MTASRFSKQPTPHPASLEEMLAGSFSALWAAAILNPYGPTIEIVALRPGLSGNDRPVSTEVIRMSLNPFSQTCCVVGHAEVGESWSPFDDWCQFLPGDLGGCPSFFLTHKCLSASQAVYFVGTIVAYFDDSLSLMDRVRRHPNDPWNRISEEIKQSASNPAANKSPTGEGPARSNADAAQDALALSSALLEPKAHRAEFEAFLACWDGASKRLLLPQRCNFPFDRLASTLGKVSVTCPLPK